MNKHNLEMSETMIEYVLSHSEDINKGINDFGELKDDLEAILSAKTDELDLIELYRSRQ